MKNRPFPNFAISSTNHPQQTIFSHFSDTIFGLKYARKRIYPVLVTQGLILRSLKMPASTENISY